MFYSLELRTLCNSLRPAIFFLTLQPDRLHACLSFIAGWALSGRQTALGSWQVIRVHFHIRCTYKLRLALFENTPSARPCADQKVLEFLCVSLLLSLLEKFSYVSAKLWATLQQSACILLLLPRFVRFRLLANRKKLWVLFFFGVSLFLYY